MTDKRILGIIPARGGSKTIPRKNIKNILNRPLISYTIVEALKSKTLSNLIVSSEDDEIIRIAKSYGASVPFIRPDSLAQDDSLAIDVLTHAILELERKENVTYDAVVMLQPTTPLRTADDIDHCVTRLFESDYDSVISVVDVGAIHPHRMKKIVNDELVDYADETVENMPRQSLPSVYIRNGAIYATKRDVLINSKSLKGTKSHAYIMPPERSLNIDENLDLKFTELLMKEFDWSHIKEIDSISVPWKSWYGNESLNLSFPESWNVNISQMNDASAISEEDISHSISNPINSEKLSILAKQKNSVCIAVDDLTKPTQAFRIIPFILDELHHAGLSDENIYFIISTGTHRSLTHDELCKKLGIKIVSKYKIYCHSAYQNNKYLGDTSSGTPVYIDNLYLQADLKIGIGTLMPHPYAGFSGGGKIVLPGLAGIESIDVNHKPVNKSLQGKIGQVENNSRRADIEEAANMAGLDFIVNTISNSLGDTASIYSGNPVDVFNTASKKAVEVYSTNVPYNMDVGIFNAFPRDTWFLLALNSLNVWGSRDSDKEIVRKGGTIVVITSASEGIGEHGLVGKGMIHHVRRDKHGTFGGPLQDRNLVFYCPTINQNYIYDHYSEDVKIFNDWNLLIRELQKQHGKDTDAVIFPNSSLQIDSNLV